MGFVKLVKASRSATADPKSGDVYSLWLRLKFETVTRMIISTCLLFPRSALRDISELLHEV
jgi:hypothetical protein